MAKFKVKTRQKQAMRESAQEAEILNLLNELANLQADLKRELDIIRSNKSSYSNFRRQLKGVKATRVDVRRYVKKRFGIGFGKTYTTPAFGNKMRPTTFLDSLGLLPGVATSIFNVISKSGRYKELITVVEWFINKFGAEEASSVWINQYFQSRSNPYEDEGLGYITNTVKGEDVLADWATLMYEYELNLEQ